MNKRTLLSLIILLLFVTGCYGTCVADSLESNQIGIHMDDGVNPTRLLGPGRHSDGGFYATYVIVDVGIKRFDWNDPSLVTSDRQPVGLSLSISVERPRDQEMLFAMFASQRDALLDDGALQALVTSRTPRVAKAVVQGKTIDQLLSRGEAQLELTEQLQAELDQFGIKLVDLGIQDIQVSPSYQAVLEAKAESQAQAEKAKTDTTLAEERLKQARAESDIAIEESRREAEQARLQAEVYKANPYALQLKQYEIMMQAIKDTDKLIFVPGDSNMNFFVGGFDASGKPVPAAQPPAAP